MSRHAHKRLSRLRAVLLAAAAAALALIAGLSVAGGAPAYAATTAKGGCTPYLSVQLADVESLGSPEPVEIYHVTWAGSSSGWSPSGSLRITATAAENGISLGSVTGTQDSTAVSTPVGGPVPTVASDAVFSVSVTASGPAGKVTCGTERLATGEGPVVADDAGDSADGSPAPPSGGEIQAGDTWTGLSGLGVLTAGASPSTTLQPSLAPYLMLTP
jgi:hypothetical protein